MKKNAFLILISIICFVIATWSLMDLYKNSNKPKPKNIELSNLDLSKIEINIEGQDLSKPYIDTLNTTHSSSVNFNISTSTNKDNINKLSKLFTNSKELFKEIGAPNRVKSIVKNLNSYAFDDYGFYIKTDGENHIISYSIYYQKGKLDISPNTVFNGELTVNGLEIMHNTNLNFLKENLNLQDYITPNYYLLKGTNENIIFNFDSSDKSLVNVLIEEK